MPNAKGGSRCIPLLASTLLFVIAWPQAIVAQDTPANYVVLQGGMSIPTGDFKDAKFEKGVTLALFYGRHLHPNFVLEAGAQVFHFEGGNTDSLIGAAFYDRDLIAWMIPLTAKGVYRDGKFGLTAGGGVDLVLPLMEWKVRTPGSEEESETATAVGFHFLAGIGFDVTRLWYLGLEGKYLITPDARFGDAEVGVNINGAFATLTVGLRF